MNKVLVILHQLDGLTSGLLERDEFALLLPREVVDDIADIREYFDLDRLEKGE